MTGIQDFCCVSLLGMGAVGRVFHARSVRTGQDVALKSVRKTVASGHHRRLIIMEKSILAAINHPNIIRLHETFRDETHLYFVLEFAARGDLGEVLHRHCTLPLLVVRSVVADVVAALDCLRYNGVIHRDLKPGNLLVAANGHVKVSDFNSARVVNGPLLKVAATQHCENMTQFVGTMVYLPPEAHAAGTDENVGFEGDLWALGCIIFEMVAGTCSLQKFVSGMRKSAQKCSGLVVDFPTYVPPELADLVRNLLKVNPKERLGSHDIQQLMHHRFFDGVNWNDLENQIVPDFSIWPVEARGVSSSALGESLEFTPNLGESFRFAGEAFDVNAVAPEFVACVDDTWTPRDATPPWSSSRSNDNCTSFAGDVPSSDVSVVEPPPQLYFSRSRRRRLLARRKETSLYSLGFGGAAIGRLSSDGFGVGGTARLSSDGFSGVSDEGITADTTGKSHEPNNFRVPTTTELEGSSSVTTTSNSGTLSSLSSEKKLSKRKRKSVLSSWMMSGDTSHSHTSLYASTADTVCDTDDDDDVDVDGGGRTRSFGIPCGCVATPQILTLSKSSVFPAPIAEETECREGSKGICQIEDQFPRAHQLVGQCHPW
eukprot:CAMPEP_0113844316 /NCGR_PEP_ID=MMETSP0372-20130328/177_1 /TAXON_ID=340204 /ORGANISM="Lankesteria abbotti" /LENGTH=598 /DNA_ID=CAMNT_0000813321 /DNA_START=68 /DNA_END=1861 /DNA_ORIENTATION=- /assembly_acc=CAM_ASM_000359